MEEQSPNQLNLDQFKEWLRTQTNLSERTIRVYSTLLNQYFKNFGDLNLESMNTFIKHNPLAKFAFKAFLEYLGKPEDYKNLIKIKEKPKKREGVYLTKEQQLEIIKNIQDEEWRMVALLQYITGARASEILKIKKEDIEKVEGIEGIGLKIKLITKGGYERVVFIPNLYCDLINAYVSIKNSEYPFMRKTSEDLTTSLMTSYHYYWKAVKKAAESIGIKDFSTHDFRRNFIDEAYTIFGDIRKVKDIVGHRKIEWTLRYLRKKIEEKELVSAIKQLR